MAKPVWHNFYYVRVNYSFYHEVEFNECTSECLQIFLTRIYFGTARFKFHQVFVPCSYSLMKQKSCTSYTHRQRFLAMKGRLWCQSRCRPRLHNIVLQFRPCFSNENYHKQYYSMFYGMLYMKTHSTHQEDIHIRFTLCRVILRFCTRENVARFTYTSQSKCRLRLQVSARRPPAIQTTPRRSLRQILLTDGWLSRRGRLCAVLLFEHSRNSKH